MGEFKRLLSRPLQSSPTEAQATAKAD